MRSYHLNELLAPLNSKVSQSVFQSVADRDGMLQSGMEEGVNDSYDRLDELLERMQKYE